MWRLKNDDSRPVITADEQLHSAHRGCNLTLPKTAIVFFMSYGIEYLIKHYNVKQMDELFPRFLNHCPIYEIKELDLCFLDGGRGAPQAVDTIETLKALGVKNIISVGMCGAYDTKVNVGEIIVPSKAFVEEGTSLHYYEEILEAYPDSNLFNKVNLLFDVKNYPIVSTDAVYRQTFNKEQLWREKGAVGIDMETSAVFSVSKYLNLNSVALLMVSDIHPMNIKENKWEWKITKEMRYKLYEYAIELAKKII